MSSVERLTSPSHLSPAERAHLELRLIEERTRLRRTLARLFADGGSSAEGRFPDHMAEQGSETMLQQLQATFASRDTETLQEIDAALRRLYRAPERFGLDEVTGEPIPFARLDVLPWARRQTAPTPAPTLGRLRPLKRRRADAA